LIDATVAYKKSGKHSHHFVYLIQILDSGLR